MIPDEERLRLLDAIEGVIEYQLGVHRLSDVVEFGNAVDALEAIFDHRSRAGTIHRHGQHWFSDEDYLMLCKDMMESRLVAQIMPVVERAKTGQEFTHAMAAVIHESAIIIAKLEKDLMDRLMRSPNPMFIKDPLA